MNKSEKKKKNSGIMISENNDAFPVMSNKAGNSCRGMFDTIYKHM